MQRLTAYFLRLVVILIGFVAAVLVAGFFLSALIFLPLQDEPSVTGRLTFVGGGLLLSSVAGYFSLAPALAAIAWSEWSGKRDWLFHALAGGAIALAVVTYRWNASTAGMDEAAATVAAGLIGGFVYWLIAGRSAGDLLSRLGGELDEA
jgi:hypothetical protein